MDIKEIKKIQFKIEELNRKYFSDYNINNVLKMASKINRVNQRDLTYKMCIYELEIIEHSLKNEEDVW